MEQDSAKKEQLLKEQSKALQDAQREKVSSFGARLAQGLKTSGSETV